MLQKVVVGILTEAGVPVLPWAQWTEKHVELPSKGIQRDDWSCGLFVMMALQAWAKDIPLQHISVTDLEPMRHYVIDSLLNLP